MGKARRSTNKEKEVTKTREGKKQKTKHDDIEGDTNSTNNLNNKSQSSECPASASARKPLIVDSMKIDSTSRPASLRSSKTKNLIETGITDLSRCSNPQKSKEHFSSTHVMQQLGDLAHQVPEGSKVESPFSSRYLKEVEPNLEDIIANIMKGIGGEKEVPLEEVHQDNEAYQVPQSSQVESPSRYLKQGEPSLRHEEIEKDASFAAEENLGDGIGEKQLPLVEKPISMVSLGITEFVKNMAVDEDDEVDSQRCAMDTVEGYTVKPESMAILRKILTRHGDILKNCTVSTMKFRSALLEMICGIISELQGKDLRQIKKDVLHNIIKLVDEIKKMEVDIEWLRRLLVDMLEAKQDYYGENFGKLKEKKDSNKKTIEDAETKLAECQEQKKKLSAKYKEVEALLESTLDEEIVCKEALAKAKDESTKTAQTIKCAISKVERFLDCSPVDDLL